MEKGNLGGKKMKAASCKDGHFIETVKTDKGYQLIMHREKREISGYHYESYLGYKERNPRLCCF